MLRSRICLTLLPSPLLVLVFGALLGAAERCLSPLKGHKALLNRSQSTSSQKNKMELHLPFKKKQHVEEWVMVTFLANFCPVPCWLHISLGGGSWRFNFVMFLRKFNLPNDFSCLLVHTQTSVFSDQFSSGLVTLIGVYLLPLKGKESGFC